MSTALALRSWAAPVLITGRAQCQTLMDMQDLTHSTTTTDLPCVFVKEEVGGLEITVQ